MLDLERPRSERAKRLVLCAMNRSWVAQALGTLYGVLLSGCASTLGGSSSDAAVNVTDHHRATDDYEVVTQFDGSIDDGVTGDEPDHAVPDVEPAFDVGIGPDAAMNDADDSATAFDAPRPIGRRVLKIESSDRSDCALVDDGSVWCWGVEAPALQRRFVLRDAGPTYLGPTRMNAPIPALDLIGTSSGYCVLDREQQVWCWGSGLEFAMIHVEFAPVLIPQRVAGARGTRLTHGGAAEHFGCVWEGGIPTCWGFYLPASSFGGPLDAGTIQSGPVARAPSRAPLIDRTSPISGIGFVGSRTVRRWAEWQGDYPVQPTSWELTIQPVQIAMNSPRSGGCAIDAEGALVCWNLRAGRSAPAVARVNGVPVGLPPLVGISGFSSGSLRPPDQIGEIEMLGRDGSLWRLRDLLLDSATQIRNLAVRSPLPVPVTDFKRSQVPGQDWLVLGHDGVVYTRQSWNDWRRFFP